MLTENKKKPLGILVISLLLGLNSFLLFGAAVMRAVMPGKFKSPESALILVILMLIIAALFGWLAIGLWRLKNWARIATAVIAGLILISMSSSLLKQHIFPNPINWWHFYIYPIVLVYLFLPSVRNAFKNK